MLNISEIFKPHHIDLIINNNDPISYCSLFFESDYRAKTGQPDFEKSMMLAKAEFALNVLLFLKETFPDFQPEIIAKLLNLYCHMLDIPVNDNNSQLDFLQITKTKINEFKQGLYQYNLIPKMKSEVALSNSKDKKITNEGKFFINKEELKKLLDYIYREYLPYIQIWYYIDNEKREIQNKEINIIVNKPIESLPLKLAKMKIEEIKKEEVKEEQKEENKADLEEEQKTDENKEEPKKDESQDINDIINSLIKNDDTKKIILEKIAELNQEVDNKIKGRMDALENKLKEIEDTSKPTKKK